MKTNLKKIIKKYKNKKKKQKNTKKILRKST